MLTKEERLKKIRVRDTTYMYQRLRERGCKLFGDITPSEMLKECFEAIRNPNKSVIIEDKRGKDSTHHCIFISDAGGYVCLPCVINDTHIVVVTIKDIKEDNQPLWYVRNYNDIGDKRNLQRMSITL